MPTTTRLPGLFLALLEKFNALSWPEMQGGGLVYVFDGITGPGAPDHYLSVGGSQAPAGSAEQQFLNLGGSSRDENATVECLVSSFVGGLADAGDYSSASDAQRAARTNAFAILAAIETALRLDKQLTTAADPPAIYWCEVGTRIEVEQTSEDDPEADKGRICTVTFDVHARAKV